MFFVGLRRMRWGQEHGERMLVLFQFPNKQTAVVGTAATVSQAQSSAVSTDPTVCEFTVIHLVGTLQRSDHRSCDSVDSLLFLNAGFVLLWDSFLLSQISPLSWACGCYPRLPVLRRFTWRSEQEWETIFSWFQFPVWDQPPSSTLTLEGPHCPDKILLSSYMVCLPFRLQESILAFKR